MMMGGKFDMISRLPDEVISIILSLLTFKEATRIYLLSHRWERLWHLYNGTFLFDFTAAPYSSKLSDREHERSKFIDRVNQVLTSIDGNNHINEFILRSYSDQVSKPHIDTWVAYAFKRGMQKLELDMEPYHCLHYIDKVPYTFPIELCSSSLRPCTILALTSLCLKSVNVNGELIEHFLSNCPLLECLCVQFSKELINLKVIGPAATFRLKYLEILCCFEMEYLEVSAPNLVYFKYHGKKKNLQLKENHKLLEVTLGGFDLMNLLLSFSSYFTQIESLELRCDVKIGMFTPDQRMVAPGQRMLRIARERPRENLNLKVVEVIGFGGYPTDLELIMYLIANCTALEKIIVNCRQPYKNDKTDAEKSAASVRAQLLRGELPPNVELVLIE